MNPDPGRFFHVDRYFTAETVTVRWWLARAKSFSRASKMVASHPSPVLSLLSRVASAGSIPVCSGSAVKAPLIAPTPPTRREDPSLFGGPFGGNDECRQKGELRKKREAERIKIRNVLSLGFYYDFPILDALFFFLWLAYISTGIRQTQAKRTKEGERYARRERESRLVTLLTIFLERSVFLW